MHRMFLKTMAIALLMSPAAYGQSLGEVARQNREKQRTKDASSTAQPKVITNENLPKSPDNEARPPQSEKKTAAAAKIFSGGQSPIVRMSLSVEMRVEAGRPR